MCACVCVALWNCAIIIVSLTVENFFCLNILTSFILTSQKRSISHLFAIIRLLLRKKIRTWYATIDRSISVSAQLNPLSGSTFSEKETERTRSVRSHLSYRCHACPWAVTAHSRRIWTTQFCEVVRDDSGNLSPKRVSRLRKNRDRSFLEQRLRGDVANVPRMDLIATPHCELEFRRARLELSENPLGLKAAKHVTIKLCDLTANGYTLRS